MSPLFFVHIPKTAGTSFRAAAIKYFGSRSVLRDYGPEAAETSDLVHQYVYKSSDLWSLYGELEGMDVKLVCGHVSAKDYAPGLGIANTLVFLRDPIQRLYSEYAHFIRHMNYKGSFREFYERPGMTNVQSRRLDTVPLESLGFVGLTERYDESLLLINQRYFLNLQPQEKNTGRRSIEEPYDIEPEDQARLQKLNQKDIDLYERACTLFEQRYRLFQEGKPYANTQLRVATTKRISGYAWRASDPETPLGISIRLNGEVVDTATATEYRPKLAHISPPRGGYVGFSSAVKPNVGDRLDCVVVETGQVFPSSPKVIKS